MEGLDSRLRGNDDWPARGGRRGRQRVVVAAGGVPHNDGMHIGVCKMTFRLPENDNLKGKRRVIHSITDRLRVKFNVAVAEVGDNEAWQKITLGIVCVSNDGRHANAMLDNVVDHVVKLRGDLELLDYEVEVFDDL